MKMRDQRASLCHIDSRLAVAPETIVALYAFHTMQTPPRLQLVTCGVFLITKVQALIASIYPE